VRFPHVGRTIIEDNAEIFPNATVARGTLGDTIVRKGAIIDCHVQIGHNAIIGERAIVIANSVIGGSSVVGNDVWISMGVTIRDSMRIEANAHIGPGCVVIQNVARGAKLVSKSTVMLPSPG
jgi:UDP-3-O-[3-hydroxymyristoyl] glucosamine N-acyltransferase